MKIGICELAYIPMRVGLSHKTEMISQLLFGELFEILIARNDWVKIRLLHDDYEGWVEESVITVVEEDSLVKEHFLDYIVCSESIVIRMNNENICIPSGSKIPASTNIHGHFTISNRKYTVPANLNNNQSSDLRKTIIESALSMLNTPYLWGGRTSWGTDCSGFSQFLYSIAGIQIPRDASQQVNKGKTLSFISEAQPGDLAFFDNEEGIITHVGIIFDHGKIIHASGKIKIDTIDHQGIYNKTLKKYTHNLRVIKSVL